MRDRLWVLPAWTLVEPLAASPGETGCSRLGQLDPTLGLDKEATLPHGRLGLSSPQGGGVGVGVLWLGGAVKTSIPHGKQSGFDQTTALGAVALS